MMRLFLILCLLYTAAGAVSAQHTMPRRVAGAGAGHATGSNGAVAGTIGQPIAGRAAGSHRLQAGFWHMTPQLALLSPNGGTILIAGSTATITWSSSPGAISLVGIEYTLNAGCTWETLVPSASNTGLYTWHVPDQPTTTAIVRIKSSADPLVEDVSDGAFAIRSLSKTAVHIRVLLEGAWDGTVQSEWLDGEGYIPWTQPYSGAPFLYAGTEERDPCTRYIPTDWVLLEFRTTPAGPAVVRRAALINNAGTITDTDGESEVLIPSAELPTGSYYVAVLHRNHTAVMSATAVPLTAGTSALYDFSISQSQAYSVFAAGMRPVAGGRFALAAGDIGNDGVVNAADRVAVRNATGATGYNDADLTFDGIVGAADRVLVVNNRFLVSQVP